MPTHRWGDYTPSGHLGRILDDKTPQLGGMLDGNGFTFNGAVAFEAKAGEALSKGNVVYVSGVSGNKPVVMKADADDAAKMPAFGVAETDAGLNANVNVVTFGTIYNIDTSAYAAGDELYVSTTAGELTTTKPAGSTALLQNMGKVIRSHASAGSIKIGGAGRTNAVPNLDDGTVFIGNASNQTEQRALVLADISDYSAPTETDPVYTASSWYSTTNNSSNWDTAYGWGNHASQNYAYTTGDTFTGTVTISGGTSDFNVASHDGATNGLKLAGTLVTATAAELNYVDGVTSNIQTQLNAKADLAGAAFTGNITAQNVPYALTGSKATTNTFTSDGGIGSDNITRSMFFRDNGGQFGSIGFHAQHATSSNYAWQMASTSYSDASKIQARVKNNGTWTSPVTIWNSGNDGSGSGLDADTVDGYEASSLVKTTDDLRDHGYMHVNHTVSNADFNTTDEAWFLSNNANGPNTGHFYHTQQWFWGGKSSGVNRAQLAIQYNGGANMYVRSIFSGTWSGWYEIYHSGNTPSRTITVAGIGRNAHHTGHLVGSYNSVGANSYKSNPIYTIGSNYNPSDAALDNMYGIGYSHTNASFIGLGASTSWGMYVAADGDARIWLGGSTGQINASGNITAYASDARLKTNVTPIENAIDKVKKIRGVTFDWVDNITSEYDFHPSSMHETGVIAQEIQEVIPDAVVTAPFNGNYTRKSGTDHNFLTVDKDKIVPLLIEAIKEQQQQIEELKEMISGTLKVSSGLPWSN